MSVTFAVEGTSESATKLRVSARGFSFVIDEPPSLGGTDEGPNPVEFILAGLAGCINIVVHMVAQERGVEIRGVSVRVEGDLDPARLMAQPTENRAGFAGIRLVAEVDSPAERAEIEEILRIAETRCPVADNLGAPTPVVLRLAEPAVV